MAILLSSSPSSHLLHHRKNPNPTPKPLPPLFISCPLKPSTIRPPLAISASLLSPPPPPPFLATSTTLASTTTPLFASTSSLFFARIPRESLSNAIYAVGSTMVKWLDIYSGVLMLRVLLSWFPNIPWKKQPLSTIRDMCDPYLGLFRKVIPPIFGTLDLSPIVAFGVLGFLNKALVRAVHSLI